jgi:hypothetical protein
VSADLDLTDPAVLDMADRNHRPTETWLIGGGGGSLAGVSCETCHHSWPCPTRVAIRALEARA